MAPKLSGGVGSNARGCSWAPRGRRGNSHQHGVWEALERDLADALLVSESPGLKSRLSSPRLQRSGPLGNCRRCGCAPVAADVEVEASRVADEEAPMIPRHPTRRSLPSASMPVPWHMPLVPRGPEDFKDGDVPVAQLHWGQILGRSFPELGGGDEFGAAHMAATAGYPLASSATTSAPVGAFGRPAGAFTAAQPLAPPQAPPQPPAPEEVRMRITPSGRGRIEAVVTRCNVAKLNLCTVLLPFWQPKKGASDADDAIECAICFENFAYGEQVRTLPCLHRYHAKCVDPWLMARWTCPLCKVEIGGGGRRLCLP